MTRAGLALSLVLLAVASAAIVVAAVLDARGRSASPETVVRGYFAALERGDLDGALLALAPSVRAPSTAFVANLLNNEYRIQGVSVRETSVLARIRGEPPGPRDVTVFLTVTQAVDGVRWEAAPRVGLVEQDQRWYLARPPLAD